MIFHRYVFKKIETNVKLKDSDWGPPTQICLENEDIGGGGGSRKSSNLIRGDHFGKVTVKGGID